jgi:putative ABC transport system ATP-binding protein
MLYTISGIDRYENGRVLINGVDTTERSNEEWAICRQTDIGIIFQQFNLIPSLTVLQNVTLPMTFLGRTFKESNEEGMKLLERLSLAPYAHRYPFELSGGQQQRVGIARALANNPPIIIADEPLGNLDSTSAKNVLAFLKELNEKDGRTIIMVTHEAWSLQDVGKIFYMQDGSVTGIEEQHETDLAESLSKKLYKQLAKTQTESGPKNISATILSHFLMRGYSEEEIKRFENFLESRLSGVITKEQFYDEIDKPFNDGGVGFWKQKAKRVSEYIEGVIMERQDVEGVLKRLEENNEISVIDEIYNIQDWLIQEYAGKLTIYQRMRMHEYVTKRVKGKITSEEFYTALKNPKRKDGVGLSLRSSQMLRERLDFVLAEGNQVSAHNNS